MFLSSFFVIVLHEPVGFFFFSHSELVGSLAEKPQPKAEKHHTSSGVNHTAAHPSVNFSSFRYGSYRFSPCCVTVHFYFSREAQ